ncbi:hypothetical protein O6H91_02G131000 [Diphasiastrum complanatum]|uniref:Uncharacterized protein n=2 Tax=Diphasiastrum complanatum TaxID=34168 RepID=A0ACC2EL11_DIPCM|nr:hypothetical protein O6H91_02G131000 [Diphasiastrum complanatum]KAJ7567068.1 hypothetical protein O6H91_02G131000 [Diphasiastrum complanatum]
MATSGTNVIVSSAIAFSNETKCPLAPKCVYHSRIVTVLEHPLYGCSRGILFSCDRDLFAPRLVHICEGRHKGKPIRAAQGSPFKRVGTQFSRASRRGTQLFQFGNRKKVQEEEEEEGEEEEEEEDEKPAFGTQLLKFATRRGSSTKRGGLSSPLVLKKDPSGLESLSLGRLRGREARTVFVAGATGQIGARISQQLLRNGFSVRGGVRDLYFAQQLAEFATQYGVISKEEARKLNAVEFDFKDVESIAKAVGNAGKVVVTVGPTEDGPQAKVTASDALRVVEAAKLANIGHLVVVSVAGTGIVDNGPFAGITAFFGNLLSRGSEASTEDLINGIVESDLTFTFIRTSSTEAIDDFSPESDNLVLLTEGIPDEGRGKVSKAQVASVVAGVFLNTSVSENKVVEVATRDYAPVTPINELLSAIPMDGRRAALQELRAKAEAEERQREARAQAEREAHKALKEARKAAELAYQLEQEAKRLAAEEEKAAAVAQRAKARAQEAAASLDNLDVRGKTLVDTLDEGAGNNVGDLLSRTLSGYSSSIGEDSSVSIPQKKGAESGNKKPPGRSASTSKAPVLDPKPQFNNIFGGLFKQETIYIDEE